MTEDVVKALGLMMLGSRMKRISERLQAQTHDVAMAFAGSNIAIPQIPVLAALDQLGSLTIGDLAESLGQSQPGVTRMIGKMVKEGLVETGAGEKDRRRRHVSLTAAGKQLTDLLKQEHWPWVEAAVADIAKNLSGPLIDQLGQLEEALAASSLLERSRRLQDQQTA